MRMQASVTASTPGCELAGFVFRGSLGDDGARVQCLVYNLHVY